MQTDRYQAVIESREFFVAAEHGEITGFEQLSAASGEVKAVYVLPI